MSFGQEIIFRYSTPTNHTQTKLNFNIATEFFF